MEFAKSRELKESPEGRSFGEKLMHAFQRHNPDIFQFSVEQVEKRQQEVHVIEEGVRNTELENFFKKYHVSGISLELDRKIASEDSEKAEGAEKIYALKVEHHFSSERLPEGYTYKGGAARALLLRNLRIDPSYVPRDLDIVRLSKEETYENSDREVAEKFMPEDFATGNGVECVDDIDEYFKTRDLTINEVLATSTTIFATESCIRDTVRNIVRPTEFEKYRFNSYGALGPKMLSKIIRFYAESIHRWNEGTLEEVPDWQFEENFIKPFWLALQLDKAFEINRNIAERFAQELVQRGQLPVYIKNAEEAVAYLASIMREDSFYFRHAPTDQFTMENDWFRAEFEKLPGFIGHGRSKKK